MKSNTLEIVFDNKNRDWYFRPLQRNVRGRFLLSRVQEPTAMAFRDRIPEDIPGQVLGIDSDTGAGYLLEPIHQHPSIRANIEKRGMSLEPERQDFPNVEVNAWLYWFKVAVDAGKARVLKGELPETVPYDPPNQLGPKPKRGPARLREIFREHPEVAAQYADWSRDRQSQWEQLVGV